MTSHEFQDRIDAINKEIIENVEYLEESRNEYKRSFEHALEFIKQKGLMDEFIKKEGEK